MKLDYGFDPLSLGSLFNQSRDSGTVRNNQEVPGWFCVLNLADLAECGGLCGEYAYDVRFDRPSGMRRDLPRR